MNGCWDSVYYDPGFDCIGNCQESWPCLGGLRGEECTVYEYHFSGGPRLAPLVAACQAAVARDSSCGTGTVDPDCELAGRVESAGMAEAYDCDAQTPCGESPQACFPASDRTLANEICSVVAEECDTWICTSEASNAISHATPWWRAETIEAARACLREPYCRNITDCLSAWRYAVFSDSSHFILFE
ncbi:MAG TPA: hypothetical protein VG937_13695 [Polyangiaceae bacterium]|jgi:hypothetical protein|nr:hypothetical protein [Polyangiaceae bacterium]